MGKGERITSRTRITMRITNKYVLFWGDYLGNWTKPPKPIPYFEKRWGGPVEEKGAHMFRSFKTSEHLFMYLKARHFKDWDTALEIIKAETPKEAKALGRKVKNFSETEWKRVRESAMFTALVSRFGVDQKFQDLLLKPEWESLEFVEASPYDKVWGIGLGEMDFGAENKSSWKGLNLLGKCLNEARRYEKFMQYCQNFEEHAFYEELKWCPSQIEYYFTDQEAGKMYVAYLRWRHSDPWSVELIEVDPSDPQNWRYNEDRCEAISLGKWYSDNQYRELEMDLIDYLKNRFPKTTFPTTPVIKNIDNWNGLECI